MDPNDLVNVPLYQHQIEAFRFVCRLFGLEDEDAETGGDKREHF